MLFPTASSQKKGLQVWTCSPFINSKGLQEQQTQPQFLMLWPRRPLNYASLIHTEVTPMNPPMRFSKLGLSLLCFALSSLAGSPALLAQEPDSSVAPLPPSARVSPGAPRQHGFWDRENVWLFAGVGAARALDYSSTLNMRRRGRQEILLTNWVVDHHPLFAGIEVGGAALSIGASYLLHRTGHHQLEHWVSIVHISAAGVGDVRNYSLQTAHPAPSASLP